MLYLIQVHFFSSHEVEKFARNTGLKLFRTSVKENLNIGRVFQYLAESHIESVSRWSDESADEFSQPVLQIGLHQQNRDVRVRFANEHELNDSNHSKSSSRGIALYHRGFKPNQQHSNGKSNHYFSTNFRRDTGKSDRIILNPFKWSRNGNNQRQNGRNEQNGGFYAHHPRYYHQHHLHISPQQQPPQKPSCRMI